MVVKLTEVVNNRGVAKHSIESDVSSYGFREVFINPEHVVLVREDLRFKQLLTEGKLPEELDKNHQFSTISMLRGHNGIDLTVIGAPEVIEGKLHGKALLKG